LIYAFSWRDSHTPRKSALNVGLSFHTPDSFFLDAWPEAFNLGDFDPKQSLVGGEHMSPDNMILGCLQSSAVILFVSPPFNTEASQWKLFLEKQGFDIISDNAMPDPANSSARPVVIGETLLIHASANGRLLTF
jgi:hypothetical protein